MQILESKRQGDILFIRTKKASMKGQYTAKKKEELTVALGEVSGHHHTAFALGDTCTINHLEYDHEVGVSNTNEIDAIFFEVSGGNVVVTHQEHDPILLEQTEEDEVWVRMIQVEFDPFSETLRRAMD